MLEDGPAESRPLDAAGLEALRSDVAFLEKEVAADRRLAAVPGSPGGDLRGLIRGVALSASGDSLRIDVEIEARRLGFGRGDADGLTQSVALFVRVEREDDAERRSRLADERVDRAKAFAEAQVHRLPEFIKCRVDAAGGTVTEPLAGLGWTIAGMVEAVSFHRRTGLRPDVGTPFGRGPTWSRARALLSAGGGRGDLAVALTEADEPFGGAVGLLFHARAVSSFLSDPMELSLSRKAISSLDAHRPSAWEHQQDCAAWLEASRVVGYAVDLGHDDLRLTLSLAMVGSDGVDGLLERGPCRAEDLARQLAGHAADGEAWRIDWIEAVLVHLLGGVASSPVAAEAIRRYRACGIEGMRRWRKVFSRLMPGQIEEIRGLIEAGGDPARPGRPLNAAALVRLCAERYGCIYRSNNLLEVFSDAGIKLSRDSGFQSLSKAGMRAAIFSAMRFDE